MSGRLRADARLAHALLPHPGRTGPIHVADGLGLPPAPIPIVYPARPTAEIPNGDGAPTRDAKVVTEAELGIALTVRGRRRVRTDGTLDIGGVTFETRAGFLAGKLVTVARSLLDVSAPPWIEHEDERYLLAPVNPEENARRTKEGPTANRPQQGLDVPFDPPGALLDALLNRGPGGHRGAK